MEAVPLDVSLPQPYQIINKIKAKLEARNPCLRQA
jgi:hypothetical protein